MRSPGKICTHTCTHTSTYAHTCMHMHWSASNLFSFLSLFCSFQWQPSHPRSSGVLELCHEGRVWRYLPNVFRTVSLWGGEESPAFPPKAIGWPRLMLSTVKTRRPSHRGALVWKGCSVGQCRVGWLSLRCLLWMVHVQAGTQLVGRGFYSALPHPARNVGAFISHKHKGPRAG